MILRCTVGTFFFVWDDFAMRWVCPRVVRDCRTFTSESVVERMINACSILTEKIWRDEVTWKQLYMGW